MAHQVLSPSLSAWLAKIAIGRHMGYLLNPDALRCGVEHVVPAVWWGREDIAPAALPSPPPPSPPCSQGAAEKRRM